MSWEQTISGGQLARRCRGNCDAHTTRRDHRHRELVPATPHVVEGGEDMKPMNRRSPMRPVVPTLIAGPAALLVAVAVVRTLLYNVGEPEDRDEQRSTPAAVRPFGPSTFVS